jgi:hypothetical protein
MRYPHAWAFFVSVATSSLVWALSPVLTGYAEAWDAHVSYYAGGLAVAGFVSGLLVPRSLWAHYLGSVAGQFGYEALLLPGGPLLLLGVPFLLGYSVILFAAAALAAHLRRHHR